MKGDAMPIIGALLALMLATPVAAQGGFDPEARLRELGITLPPPPAPVANYVPAVTAGTLVFTAGHGECPPRRYHGVVGRDLTLEQGRESARLTGICLLATLKAHLGDLRRVKRIVKVVGFVNAAPGFTDQPQVMNGFSDLMVAVFGEERGRHARSAVGAASLPLNIPVEIEMVVEIEP
jgi:enamine deaminase RidA (YjgF/YER057c/UK114 family)